MNCKKRTCPHCGNLWAGDVKVMLLQNLNDGYNGPADMVTITAPGMMCYLTRSGTTDGLPSGRMRRGNGTLPLRLSGRRCGGLRSTCW
jgi:hypothetical protein